MKVVGAAWLSSVLVVRSKVKSYNECNPRLFFGIHKSKAIRNIMFPEGGEDVKLSWPVLIWATDMSQGS